jgi:hypothetical protein
MPGENDDWAFLDAEGLVNTYKQAATREFDGNGPLCRIVIETAVWYYLFDPEQDLSDTMRQSDIHRIPDDLAWLFENNHISSKGIQCIAWVELVYGDSELAQYVQAERLLCEKLQQMERA